LPKKTPLIRYTSKDYESIRNDLIEFAKRYYPNTVKDFNEASFGMLMIETVSYIGDILSFYTDYQANESFLDTAIEYNNVIRHARTLGYRYQLSPSAMGMLSFYVMIPANSVGLGPNASLIPILKKGSQFSTSGNNNFILLEDVDFSKNRNEVVVARVDETTGVPTSYAIKAHGRAISGKITTKTVSVGAFEKFKRIPVGPLNVSEILSVMDDEGHEYFEVPHLSQDVVYLPVPNYNDDKTEVPAILKPVPIPRRFTVERENGTVYLQFGYGSDTELVTESVVDPARVVLDMHGREFISDTSFDPSKIIETDKFGIAPANTQLTIEYRINTADSVNARVGTINNVVDADFKFLDRNNLLSADVDFVIQSLEVINDEPFVGDVSVPTSEEIKIKAKNHFSTQNRAVTSKDYESLIYSMPSSFGNVKRCKIVQNSNSFKRNLNLYVLSEDDEGKLTTANNTLKRNIKSWIQNHRMINDTIDILDAKVVDFAIKFQIIAEVGYDKYEALNNGIYSIRELFSVPQDIGEPISISSIYNTLNKTKGIEDTVDVEIIERIGVDYSTTRFNFDKYITADGRLVRGFKNICYQLKYPLNDIEGSVL
jgi:hypothetical protein